MNREAASISQAFAFGRTAWRANWRLFLAIMLTLAASWVVLEIIVIAGQRFGLLLWVVAHLAFLSFFAGVQVAFMRISLDLVDGSAPTYRDAFAHLGLGPAFVLGQLLYLMLVLLGLVLLLIPGMIAFTRLALFGLVLADGERSLIESFKHSTNLTAGQARQLFGLLLGLLLFNLAGAAVLGLGLLVTVPISVLTLASFYRQLW